MASEDCTVRQARVTDVQAILDLSAEMDRVHREQHPELVQPITVVVRDAALVEARLVESNTAAWVAEVNEDGRTRVCGFVRVLEKSTPEGLPLTARRFAYIDDLVVREDARRRGIASQLFSAAEEWARARSLPVMEATVWAFNRPMLEMCEKQGVTVLRHYVRKRLDP